MGPHRLEVRFSAVDDKGVEHSGDKGMYWNNLSDDVYNIMLSRLQSILVSANQHHNLYRGHDNDNLTVTLTGNADGQEMPEKKFEKVSYKSFVKQQRLMHNWLGELLDNAEELAEMKKAKK